MALSVALPLSGLETENFSSFSAFGLRDILGLSQSSPSPSVSSDSSGIGSLGSLKSESLSASLPSSPQTTEIKLFEHPAQEPETQVQYRGRNLLQLQSNISARGWGFRYAYLPTNNTAVFFANRSQYHRLSVYKEVEHPQECCAYCGFTYPAA